MRDCVDLEKEVIPGHLPSTLSINKQCLFSPLSVTFGNLSVTFTPEISTNVQSHHEMAEAAQVTQLVLPENSA